jgi:exopolyphosphatase/guanosine-5'-triphosphate,3'-diphosphate pyrophosphatase
MSAPRFAAIDIGSDTIHLIVVERERGDRLKHIREKSRLMELGLLEKKKGTLPDYAQSAILRTLESLVRQARDAGASTILIGATAAVRSDPRHREIVARLTRAVGAPVHIISKQREIELGILAVRHSLRPAGRQIFVDGGGGSTEITVCEGRKPVRSISLPVGASELSLLLEGDPPELLSFARLMVPIQNALRKAPIAAPVRSALFSGGTAHHVCDVAGESRALVTRAALERALRHLLKKPARKIAKKYGIDAQRVPLLISGAVILAAILEHFGLDRTAVTSETIREGMIRAYLRHPNSWWKG